MYSTVYLYCITGGGEGGAVLRARREPPHAGLVDKRRLLQSGNIRAQTLPRHPSPRESGVRINPKAIECPVVSGSYTTLQ